MTERKSTTCDCGHRRDEHYIDGCCDLCGCTWWWPNVRCILARKKRKAAKRRRR